jgi:hypothetical protein
MMRLTLTSASTPRPGLTPRGGDFRWWPNPFHRRIRPAVLGRIEPTVLIRYAECRRWPVSTPSDLI